MHCSNKKRTCRRTNSRQAPRGGIFISAIESKPFTTRSFSADFRTVSFPLPPKTYTHSHCNSLHESKSNTHLPQRMFGTQLKFLDCRGLGDPPNDCLEVGPHFHSRFGGVIPKQIIWVIRRHQSDWAAPAGRGRNPLSPNPAQF